MIETIEKFIRAVKFNNAPEYFNTPDHIIVKIDNPDYQDGLSDQPFIMLPISKDCDVQE